MKSISEICKEYSIENYTINDDGSIDVNGRVDLRRGGLTELPLKFGIVNGSFYCSVNKLTTLKGCPKYVGGYFDCSNNELTSLEFCPEEVGESFNCMLNKLTSLEYSPIKINNDFNCNDNYLTTLEGGPVEVGGDFYCSVNEITSLKGCPKYIGNDMYLKFNKIRDLYGISDDIGRYLFCNKENPISSIINERVDIDFIRAFNIYKVIKDGKVQLKRLKYVMETFNMEYYLEEIKEHYEIN